MEHFNAIFCITVFCLCIRVPFILVEDTDTWLTYLLLITNRKKTIPDLAIPNSTIPGGQMPYPPLVHFLASRLPEEWAKTGAYGISLISDAFVAMTVYGFLITLLPTYGVAMEDTSTLAIGMSLVFLSLPILMPISARLKSPNGRAPGLLLTTLFYASIWFAIHSSKWFLFPAIVAVYLVVLTSKFSLQTLFFITPLACLFLHSALPLVPLVFLVADILIRPDSMVAMICRDKISHSLRYKIEGSTAEFRNIFPNFLKYFTSLRKNYLTSVLMLRYRAPLLIAIVSIPHAFFILVSPFIFPGSQNILATPFLAFCFFITAASTLVFLLTATGPLRVLGEAERYFECASPFVMILAGLVLADHGMLSVQTIFLLLCINLLLLAFLHVSTNIPFLRNIGTFKFAKEKDILAVHEFIKCQPPCKIVPVPVKLSYIFMGLAVSDGVKEYRFYHPTISPFPVRLSNYVDKKKDMENPFIFKNTPKWLQKKYGINMIIEDTSYTMENLDKEFVQALHKYKPAFEAGKLRVFLL